MFPAFLPDPDTGGTFVFADTLGFHAVGMVPDHDKEPKAAVAILARALGEKDSSSTAPTVGGQSAAVLGDEIVKYLDCHDASRLLRVHALRAGDGLTIARSLGRVHEHYRPSIDEEAPAAEAEAARHPDEEPPATPSFSLELYPSSAQRGIAGRFIAEAREKRRSGAGVSCPRKTGGCSNQRVCRAVSTCRGCAGRARAGKIRRLRRTLPSPSIRSSRRSCRRSGRKRASPGGPVRSRHSDCSRSMSVTTRTLQRPLWRSTIPHNRATGRGTRRSAGTPSAWSACSVRYKPPSPETPVSGTDVRC